MDSLAPGAVSCCCQGGTYGCMAQGLTQWRSGLLVRTGTLTCRARSGSLSRSQAAGVAEDACVDADPLLLTLPKAEPEDEEPDAVIAPDPVDIDGSYVIS